MMHKILEELSFAMWTYHQSPRLQSRSWALSGRKIIRTILWHFPPRISAQLLNTAPQRNF